MDRSGKVTPIHHQGFLRPARNRDGNIGPGNRSVRLTDQSANGHEKHAGGGRFPSPQASALCFTRLRTLLAASPSVRRVCHPLVHPSCASLCRPPALVPALATDLERFPFPLGRAHKTTPGARSLSSFRTVSTLHPSGSMYLSHPIFSSLLPVSVLPGTPGLCERRENSSLPIHTPPQKNPTVPSWQEPILAAIPTPFPESKPH